jgi:hypothetical protein
VAALSPAGVVEWLARLPRFRAAAMVSLASLYMGATAGLGTTARSVHGTTEEISWRASWAIAVAVGCYLPLLCCALVSRRR